MSLQDGVNLAEVEELILLKVACLRPHGVQHRSRVTLREQNGQPLPWRHGSNCHFIQIQNSKINLMECCVRACARARVLLWRGWNGHCLNDGGLQVGISWYERRAQTWSRPRCNMTWDDCDKMIKPQISSVQINSELVYLHICSLKFSDCRKVEYITHSRFRNQGMTNKWRCLWRISSKGSRKNETYVLKTFMSSDCWMKSVRLFTLG